MIDFSTWTVTVETTGHDYVPELLEEILHRIYGGDADAVVTSQVKEG